MEIGMRIWVQWPLYAGASKDSGGVRSTSAQKKSVASHTKKYDSKQKRGSTARELFYFTAKSCSFFYK